MGLNANDIINDEEQFIRRTGTARKTRSVSRDMTARQPGYQSRRQGEPRRVLNDLENNAEVFDDIDKEEYYEPLAEQRKRLLNRGKLSPARQALHPTRPKRDFIQVIMMFLLSAGVFGLSAWQVWTLDGINASALSIKWVHVTQALIALQVLVLFFTVDLKKQE